MDPPWYSIFHCTAENDILRKQVDRPDDFGPFGISITAKRSRRCQCHLVITNKKVIHIKPMPCVVAILVIVTSLPLNSTD